MIDITRRSIRSLLSAKTRTILTALAIAVGTFALTLTLAASNGAQNYADVIISDNFDPSQLIVASDKSIFSDSSSSKPQTYDPNFGSVTTGAGAITQVKRLNDSDLARLKQVPGVESVEPGFSVNLQYITRDGQKKYVATLQAFDSYRNPALLAGEIPDKLPSKSVILPEAFLQPLGFKDAGQAVGQTIRLAARQQADQSSLLTALNQGGVAAADKQLKAASQAVEQQFKVIAVAKKPSTVQPGTELYLFSNATDANELNDFTTKGTNDYRKYITANVKIAGGNDEAVLNAAKANIEKIGYGSMSVKDTEELLTQIIMVLQGIVTVFGLIAVVASVFGIINTMYISVLQRTREIGLMKALGMHKRDITRLFRLEAAMIGLLGGLLGAGIAVALGTAMNPWITKKLALGDTHLLEFQFDQIGLLILSLIVVATLSGLLPARKASRLDPIEALRVE